MSSKERKTDRHKGHRIQLIVSGAQKRKLASEKKAQESKAAKKIRSMTDFITISSESKELVSEIDINNEFASTSGQTSSMVDTVDLDSEQCFYENSGRIDNESKISSRSVEA